jgi:serine/threonine protein kinase
LTGSVLAHYRLTGTLGEGGMGVVYRATDTKLDREVAIKVLPPAVEPGEVPRFSSPRELFRQPIEGFDVTPDGQRFVALRRSDSDLDRPLTLISGWTLKLPRR